MAVKHEVQYDIIWEGYTPSLVNVELMFAMICEF